MPTDPHNSARALALNAGRQGPSSSRPLLVTTHDTARLTYRHLSAQWPQTSFLVDALASPVTVREALRRRLSTEQRREMGAAEPECAHVRVRWTDGPMVSDVSATCSLFHGTEFHASLGRWMVQESLLALPTRDGYWPVPALVRYDAGSARLHRSLSTSYRTDLLHCAQAFGFADTGDLLTTPWGLMVDHPKPVADLLSNLLPRRAAHDGTRLSDPVTRRDFVLRVLELPR